MLKIVRDTKSGGRKITFSLPADHAGGVISVVGNFNEWTPGETVLAKRGATQSASVCVLAEYITVFRYLGEGDYWFDEADATYVDAGASVILPPAPKAVRKTAAPRATAAKVAAAETTSKAAPAKKVPATRAVSKATPAKKAPATKAAPVRRAAK